MKQNVRIKWATGIMPMVLTMLLRSATCTEAFAMTYTTVTTCQSIQISWTPISNYTVTYYMSGDVESKHKTTESVNSTSVTLNGLAPNTEYTVLVNASNSDQTGQAANITVKTDSRNTVNMTATRASNTNLKIEVGIASPQTYTCSARDMDTGEYTNISTNTDGTGIFPELKKNTEYSINCTAVDNACIIASTTATTRIGAPGPPAITMRSRTCQSIQISWTVPTNTGGDKIGSYTVTYYISGAEEGEHKQTIITNNTMSVTLRELAPNTEYTVLVRASNSEQTGDAANITVKTQSRGPGNITVKEATINISATSARLQHSLGQLVHYKCNTTGTSTDQFNIPAGDGYTLSGLSADTTYTVNCVAYEDRVEHCLEANITFTTLPGTVNNIQLVNMGRVTMDGRTVQQIISWKRPKHHSSTLNYTITHGRESEVSRSGDSSANETTVNVSNTTVATLTLLLPASTAGKDEVNYKVWVAARSRAGQGEYSEQFNIRYTAPTEPKNVTVVPLSCNSVNITWKPPLTEGHLALTQYTIHFHGPTMSMTTDTNTTFLKVNNLIPGDTYTVQVKASNGFKGSRLSEAATNTTQMRDRKNIATFNATSTKISLTLVHNKKAFECHVDSKDMAVGFDNNRNGQVSDLTPDTDYNIGCVGTANKTKCFEQNKTVRTAPGRVKSVMTTGLGMVVENIMYQRISWEKPQNHSSQLTYTVKYGMNTMINHANNMATHNITGTATTVMFKIPDKLTTPLSYNVWVAAVSAAGEGPYSWKIDANYGAPTAPINFTIGEHTCNALLLRWTAPELTGGLPITEYKIEYLENSNSTMVEGNMTFATIENLHPNTTYKIRVRALNSLGSGMFIKMKPRTVQRNSTTSIQVQATSSTSVQVTRTIIGDEQYKCILNTSQSTAVRLTTSKRTATVPALLADTMYSISCIEVDTEDNYQCTEYNTTVHTELSAVTGLVNISAVTHNTSHYNQEIQWNRTTSTKQVISNYSILYMKNGDENNQTNSEATRSATLILPLPSVATSYKVWVAAVGSVTGVGEYSQPLIIPLDVPQVPINVEVKNRQCNKLTIIWKEPDNTGGLPIHRYEIATYQPDGSRKNFTSMKTSVGLDFFPNSSQTIQVRTVNSIGTSNFTGNYTFESVPRDPTRILTARAISAMRIEITRKGNTGNETYQCWINDTQNRNTTILEMSGLFVDLLPDTIYAIDCVEVDSKGKYLCKEYNNSVLTKPGKVKELTFNGLGQVKGDKIHQNISWQRPDNHINELEYIVTMSNIKRPNRSMNVKVSSNFSMLELKKSKLPIKYIVKVAAMSSAGIGEYSEDKKLQYKEPGQPTNVTATAPSCNTITVVWSAPNDSGGLPITGYTVKSRASSSNNERTENHTTLSASIRNVFPGIQYTVLVAAVNLETGQFSDDQSITMPIRDNTSSIKVSLTSHTTLLLSSTSTEADYKCRVSNNMEYDLLSENSTEVLSLEYDTEYSVDCVEMEDGYAQCTEYNTTILTGLPEVMNLQHQDITVYDSTNIHQPLTWQSLTSNHQAVTNYSIRYSLSAQECSQQDGAFEEVTSTTNRQTLVLPVPMNETQYTVCVAAVGSETGTGEYSKLQINYTEPDAPLLRAIDVQSCKNVIVAWDAPQDKGGLPVQGYQLHYYSTSDPTQEPVVLNISGNTTEKELDNLLPGTEYTFVIKATTSIATDNNNTLSNTTHFRGSAVEILIVTQDKSRMINITSKYRTPFICWINKTKDQYENYTVNKITTVEGLQPDTLYSIECVEINNNGEYQCRELNTTALTGLPPPTNVTIGSVSLNNKNTKVLQTIQWDWLKSGHQMVEQYTFKYGIGSEIEKATKTDVNLVMNEQNKIAIKFLIPQEPITYFVWVAVKGSRTGVGEYSEALQITYTAPNQPSKINTANLTCNAIQLTWEQPENDGGLPIQGYHVSYSTATGNYSTYTTESSIEWLDRLPNTTYDVCIRANNSILNQTCEPYSITTSPRNKTTDEEVSLNFIPPGRLKFVKRITTTNRFTCWVVGENSITSFYLEKWPSNKNVRHLQTDSQYTLSCVEIDGMNQYQCKEFNRTTSIGVPKVTLPPEQRQAEELNETHGHFKQHIIWENVPPSSDQNITNYTMLIRTDDTNQVTETNRTIHTNFEELSLPIPTFPITYYIQVAAVGSKTGQGEYSDNFTRTYTYPEPPDDLTVGNKSISCNTYSIKWTEMVKSGELPVTNYTVTVTNSNNAVIYNETISPKANMSEHQLDLDNYYSKSKLFQDLLPNMTYTVHITTTNLLGESKDNKIVTATTMPKENLSIEMQPFSSTGAHLLIWPQYNNTVNYACSLTALQAENYTKSTIELNNTLSELSPNTTYSVWCLVYEEARERELCYEGRAEGRTFPLKPEKPPTNITVNAITSDRFVLTWSGPEGYQNNQDIRGYQVTYNWTSDDERKLRETNTTSLTYTASNLTSGTEHTVAIAAYTANGTGIYSDPLKITTIPAVENITATNITAASTVIKWNPPPQNYNYTIWLESRVADNFTYWNSSIILTSPTSNSSYTLTDLDSFRNYSISMYLELSNLGNGTDSKEPFETQGKEPTSTPNNRTVNPNKKIATLQWRIPSISGRNGIITNYTINWRSHGTVQAQTSPIIYNLANPNFTHPEDISYTLSSLTPYTNYTWRVAAVNEKGDGPFSEWNNFTTDEDIPSKVQNVNIDFNKPEKITVTWEKPATPNGRLTRYVICIQEYSQENCSYAERNQTEVTITNLQAGVPYNVSVWAVTSAGPGNKTQYAETIFTKELTPNASVSDVVITWIEGNAVNISWEALPLRVARGNPLYTVNVTSGGVVVWSREVNTSSVQVLGLSRTTVYSVVVRVSTLGGQGNDSKPVSFGTEPAEDSYVPVVAGIIAVVMAALAVVICIVVCIVVRRRQRRKVAIAPNEELPLRPLYRDNTEEPQGQRREAISRDNFCAHVKHMHQDKSKPFKEEFSSVLQAPDATHTAAQNNPLRNRYVNIYPYDNSRVILMAHDGSDYINAAYIDGYYRPKAYIASQGPIQSTVADFWEMIWEHKSPVIVMLTRLKEGDRPKCIQYWSEEINVPYEPGRNLSVVTTRMDTTPSYEMRHFEVTKTSEKSSPLKVKQFLYTAWPDHGVPQYSSSMVKFIMEQIRPEVQNSSAPIIVHCSAGAGRTGTLIAIDTTIDRLKEEGDINIFECVELMRARRTQMVQNVNQYMYIHDAINDYVSCGNTTIVAHELGPKIALLSTKNPGQDKTGYEQQFQALEDLSPVFSDADRSFALKAEAKDKIRYTDRFTYSDNCIRTEIKEKYVNATQIKGYYGQNHFIAAQAPMKKTVEDTWNVIREQDCKVVVVLCKLTDEDDAELEMSCIQFCPSEPGKTTSTDSYTFTALRVDQTAGYTTTEVSSVVEDEEPVLITVYQYKNWKKNGRPEVSSLLRLMGDVQRSLSGGNQGSLMVMCDDGMSRTGVFITVMSEIDRVKVEGEMDIFQTIKAARTARPYMVSTVVDYEVCHEIIHNYLESFDTYANFK